MRSNIIKKFKSIRGRMVKVWQKYFTDQEITHIKLKIPHLNLEIDDFVEIQGCYVNNISKHRLCIICGNKTNYNRNQQYQIQGWPYLMNQYVSPLDMGNPQYQNFREVQLWLQPQDSTQLFPVHQKQKIQHHRHYFAWKNKPECLEQKHQYPLNCQANYISRFYLN